MRLAERPVRIVVAGRSHATRRPDWRERSGPSEPGDAGNAENAKLDIAILQAAYDRINPRQISTYCNQQQECSASEHSCSRERQALQVQHLISACTPRSGVM